MPEKLRFTLKDIKEIKKLFGGEKKKKPKKTKATKAKKVSKLSKTINARHEQMLPMQQQQQQVNRSTGGYLSYNPAPLPFRSESMSANEVTNQNRIRDSEFSKEQARQQVTQQVTQGDYGKVSSQQTSHTGDVYNFGDRLGVVEDYVGKTREYKAKKKDIIDRNNASNVFASSDNGSVNFTGGNNNGNTFVKQSDGNNSINSSSSNNQGFQDDWDFPRNNEYNEGDEDDDDDVSDVTQEEMTIPEHMKRAPEEMRKTNEAYRNKVEQFGTPITFGTAARPSFSLSPSFSESHFNTPKIHKTYHSGRIEILNEKEEIEKIIDEEIEAIGKEEDIKQPEYEGNEN